MPPIEQEEEQEVVAKQPTAQSGLNRIVKVLAYIALGLLGVILMSVIAYFVARAAAVQQFKEVSSIAVVKPPPPTENYNFSEEFQVNTADEEETHFVRMKLTLGFEQGNPNLTTEIGQRQPQLRNIVNLILAGKSSKELVSVEDRLNLQEEIKASINHVLSNGKILEVYFSDLLVN